MIKTKIFLLGSTAALFAMPAAALAQDIVPAAAAAPDQENTVPDDQSGVGEIIVTAQKREQTLQRTSAAVEVVSGAQLIDRGVTDINRLTTQVTGVVFTPNRSGVQIFARGLGQSDGQQQTTPAIEVQLDGLTLPKTAQQVGLFDIADIQILKGPQGILYGRNAIGGAVIINTRRPTMDRVKTEGSFEYGNYDLVHLTGAVNVPLSDSVAVRAAVDYLNRDGYLSNGANDQDTISTRLSLLAEPTDRLSIFLSGSYSHRRGHGFSQSIFPFPAAADGDPWYVEPVPSSGTVGAANFDDYHNRGWNVADTYMVNGEISYDLTDYLSLKYVGGYLKYRDRQVNANATMPGSVLLGYVTNYFTNNSQDVQNEVRLNYDSDTIHAVVGASQHWTKAPGVALQLAYKNGAFPNGPLTAKETNYAIFGDISAEILDGLRLEVGGRQSWDQKGISGTVTGQPLNLNSSNFPEFKNFSWKVGAEYDVAPSIMTYASIQTGYLPGAYQTVTNTTLASLGIDRRYKSQTLTAYTAGVKSRLFDNRLTLNAEAFYYDYKNFQVSQRVELLIGGVQSFQTKFANIAKSRIYGLDVDATLKILENGTFTAGASFLNAKIRDTGFTSLAVLQSNGTFMSVADPSLHGFDLPNSPRLTLNLGYEHVFPLGNGGDVTAKVDTHHESSKFLDYTHPDTPGAVQDSFWKTDVSLTYHAPNGVWSVSGWARNLENSPTYSVYQGNPLRSNGTLIGAFGIAFIDAPRTYGVRLSFNY